MNFIRSLLYKIMVRDLPAQLLAAAIDRYYETTFDRTPTVEELDTLLIRLARMNQERVNEFCANDRAMVGYDATKDTVIMRLKDV